MSVLEGFRRQVVETFLQVVVDQWGKNGPMVRIQNEPEVYSSVATAYMLRTWRAMPDSIRPDSEFMRSVVYNAVIWPMGHGLNRSGWLAQRVGLLDDVVPTSRGFSVANQSLYLHAVIDGYECTGSRTRNGLIMLGNIAYPLQKLVLCNSATSPPFPAVCSEDGTMLMEGWDDDLFQACVALLRLAVRERDQAEITRLSQIMTIHFMHLDMMGMYKGRDEWSQPRYNQFVCCLGTYE